MSEASSAAPSVLITGCSRGLGLEFTRQLATSGARVIATCRDPNGADALNALAAQHRGRVEVLALDVGSPAAIKALARRLGEQGQTLDWLINNAGVLPTGEKFGAIDADILSHTLAVDAVAPFLLAQALAPLLRRGRAPRIANISSALGSIAGCEAFRTPSYAIAKAALNMASVLLARALSPDGIRVVALHPGWVRTDMGGEGAEIDPQTSVSGLLSVIESLTENTDGAFLDYRGKTVPW